MLIRRMIKILFIVCFLASPLWAQVTSENDTVRFKFNPTSFDDPDVLEKAIELFWYDAGTGIKEFVAMAANLKSEKFEDVWFWQTYNFNNAETYRWVSPKLPAGCKLLNLGVNFTTEKFVFSANLRGLPCKALFEALKIEKLHIQFVNVPVIDETTVAPLINMHLDDLPEVIRSLSI